MGRRETIPILPLGPVTAWSFSTLMDYETCPYKVYLAKVEKSPRPPVDENSPLERGNRVHKDAERFVLGEIKLARELKDFAAHFESLRDKYKQGKVLLEEDWAHARDLMITDWRSKDAWLRLKCDAVYFIDKHTICIIDYKGLPLSTPLPTPSGWTTMGEVAVGDQLIDAAGNPCTVVGKSQVKYLPNYRITFDDTSVAECDAEHLWTLHDGSVVPITDLRPGHMIRVAAPLRLPAADLPVDPYVLGLWLADGKHTSGEISKPDTSVWDEVKRRGYAISHDYSARANDGKCRVHTVIGLRKQLRKLGVLGSKHIPAQYLRASHTQRLDLLRGLMDGDGSANHTRVQAVLNTTSETMARQVHELLLTLGQRPLLSPYKARGFGKEVKAWMVSFRPNGIQPFAMPRKAEKVAQFSGPGRSWRREVKRIEQLPPQATQCVAVDSPDHTFLCTEKFIPTHNTGRKFGNEIKHAQQGQLYAGIVAERYPEVTKIIVEFWYTDQDDITTISYTRRQSGIFLSGFLARAEKMTTAVDFPPKPSVNNCRYCDFGTNKGTGVCGWAVKP